MAFEAFLSPASRDAIGDRGSRRDDVVAGQGRGDPAHLGLHRRKDRGCQPHARRGRPVRPLRRPRVDRAGRRAFARRSIRAGLAYWKANQAVEIKKIADAEAERLKAEQEEQEESTRRAARLADRAARRKAAAAGEKKPKKLLTKAERKARKKRVIAIFDRMIARREEWDAEELRRKEVRPPRARPRRRSPRRPRSSRRASRSTGSSSARTRSRSTASRARRRRPRPTGSDGSPRSGRPGSSRRSRRRSPSTT